MAECFTDVNAPAASRKMFKCDFLFLMHFAFTLVTIPTASSLLRFFIAPYVYRLTGFGLLRILALQYARANGHTPHTGLLPFAPILPLCFGMGHTGEWHHCAGAVQLCEIARNGPFSRSIGYMSACLYMIFQTSDGTEPSTVVRLFFC